MIANTNMGGAGRLHGAVVERYAHAEREAPQSLRDVLMRTGELRREAQYQDPESGVTVSLLPRRRSWLMSISHREHDVDLPIADNVTFRTEPLKVVVDPADTQLITGRRLVRPSSLAVEALTGIATRMEPMTRLTADTDVSLAEAIRVETVAQYSPEGHEPTSISQIAKSLIQMSMAYPGNQMVSRVGRNPLDHPSVAQRVLAAATAEGLCDFAFSVPCNENEVIDDKGIDCQATFPKIQWLETEEGLVVADRVSLVLLGSDARLPTDATANGYTQLAPDTLVQFQELLRSAYPIPYKAS